MILRWFLSAKVRQAVAMRRHVEKLLAAQSDILSPQAIQAVNEGIVSLRTTVEQGADKAALQAEMEKLEETANKWLKPYPNAAWRENVEVFLVALAVAMAIRTFFLQPFKIPTGSMQPTLYGITSVPDFLKSLSEAEAAEQIAARDSLRPSHGIQAIKDWFGGVTYLTYQAEADGVFNGMSRPLRFLLFNIKQTIWFAGKPHNLWFPPDCGGGNNYEASGGLFGYIGAILSTLPADELAEPYLERRAGLRRGQNFAKGDEVLKIKVIAGDHLFVNRITYNFRHPERGDIIVFKTAGVNHPNVPQNQHYIKRLVVLGGEQVSIGEDHHLIINGERLDSSTPHFENIYNFRPDAGDNQYFGHLPAWMLSDATQQIEVRSNYYMVMGDNTRNSLDSRYFGDFSREYVIGKSSFIYWPITSRFGFGYR